jgi:hypothetical protein
MRSAVDDRLRRNRHGDRRSHAFQAMVAGAVEQVGDGHGAGGFSGKIEGEAGGAAGKNAGDGIQFLATALQVLAGDREVGRIDGCNSNKKKGVLGIPKVVRPGRFRKRRLNGRRRLNHGIGHVGGDELLGRSGHGDGRGGQQNCGFQNGLSEWLSPERLAPSAHAYRGGKRSSAEVGVGIRLESMS